MQCYTEKTTALDLDTDNEVSVFISPFQQSKMASPYLSSRLGGSCQNSFHFIQLV